MFSIAKVWVVIKGQSTTLRLVVLTSEINPTIIPILLPKGLNFNPII